jgi:hypothetical protein
VLGAFLLAEMQSPRATALLQQEAALANDILFAMQAEAVMSALAGKPLDQTPDGFTPAALKGNRSLGVLGVNI